MSTWWDAEDWDDDDAEDLDDADLDDDDDGDGEKIHPWGERYHRNGRGEGDALEGTRRARVVSLVIVTGLAVAAVVEGVLGWLKAAGR